MAGDIAAARRSLWSLILDRLAFGIVSRIRRRSRRNSIFRGMVVPVDDLIGQHIMAAGRFEATQIDGVRQFMANAASDTRWQSGTFVDIGANIGLYTIALAQMFGRTVAIEANPQTFRILQANIGLLDVPNVTTICAGASDRAAQGKIHVPLNGNLGWGTLDADHHRVPTRSHEIVLRTLDEMLADHQGQRVAMIKIDVEGHELHVLEGARQTLSKDQPVILFEVLNAAQGQQCAALLDECGYSEFYAFKRALPAAGNWPARLWRGMVHGLPVEMRQVAATQLSHAALICAMASPIRNSASSNAQRPAIAG